MRKHVLITMEILKAECKREENKSKYFKHRTLCDNKASVLKIRYIILVYHNITGFLIFETRKH